MHRSEFFAVVGQAQFPGRNLMTGGTPELFKASGFFLLLCSAIFFLFLGDDVHGRQQADATFEIPADFLAPFGKSESSTGAHGMTVFAAMVFEDEGRQLARALAFQIGFFETRSRLVRPSRFHL